MGAAILSACKAGAPDGAEPSTSDKSEPSQVAANRQEEKASLKHSGQSSLLPKTKIKKPKAKKHILDPALEEFLLGKTLKERCELVHRCFKQNLPAKYHPKDRDLVLEQADKCTWRLGQALGMRKCLPYTFGKDARNGIPVKLVSINVKPRHGSSKKRYPFSVRYKDIVQEECPCIRGFSSSFIPNSHRSGSRYVACIPVETYEKPVVKFRCIGKTVAINGPYRPLLKLLGLPYRRFTLLDDSRPLKSGCDKKSYEQLRDQYQNSPPFSIHASARNNNEPGTTIRYKHTSNAKKLLRAIKDAQLDVLPSKIEMPECQTGTYTLAVSSYRKEQIITFPKGCDTPVIQKLNKIVTILEDMPDIEECPNQPQKSVYDIYCSRSFRKALSVSCHMAP
ncbi:MAG: hypothetical protein QNJ97_24260 [Myxococcota bacterium]|nr:hypothetical protein [Myxococcota bacterium]